jgi:hypothetical protein
MSCFTNIHGDIKLAQNVFNIVPAHNKARLSLHGDMSLAFNEAVSTSFSIQVFTSTNELFSLDTATFQFRDLAGNLVSGILFGGRPGMFMELMFDPEAGVWYITANNLIGASGGSDDDTEKTLVMSVLPNKTPINYENGKNYRALLTDNAKLANPTGMNPGDRMKIVVVQDITGGRTLSYDTVYGFPEAVIPALSTRSGAIDVLDFYMTGDRTLICDLKRDYSVILPLAYANNKFYFNINSAYAEAQSNPVNGQTVRVTRSGWRAESTGTIGFEQTQPLNIRVMGNVQPDGTYPTLRLNREFDRPSFGKALINIEGGDNVVIENLGVAGAVADAGNGTGILINAKAKYTLIKNVYLSDNENGIRSNEARTQQYDLINVYCNNNGWSIAHAGFSHSIYAGKAGLWRALSCSFTNSVAGHNIKSRALAIVLKQVFCKRSVKARELDCPDQTVLQVSDSVFWKDGDAVQNNLVGIGHEMTDGLNRKQEYFFVNCYFHNDLNADRDVTYVENWFGDGTPNTVPVHFIDCEFGGTIKDKGAAIFKGPYTITLTGGPVGPRVPVGDPRRLFNMAERDPNRVTNPNNIALTPLASLPPMTVLDPTPEYPTFLPLDPTPTVPSPGGGSTTPTTPAPDTTAPSVTLSSSATSVTTSSMVTLTATASDNVGVTKVEFKKDGVSVLTKTAAPFTLTQAFDHTTNGTFKYVAIASDSAGNTKTSNEVTITVNVPAPVVAFSDFDSETKDEYQAAIAEAPAGEKRMAAAESLVTSMGEETHQLNIYQDGVLIVPAVFSGPLVAGDDFTNIYVTTGTPVSNNPVKAGDLAVGVWTFELIGGPNMSRTYQGTVGGVGSGKDLILTVNPEPGVPFVTSIKFIVPAVLDAS